MRIKKSVIAAMIIIAAFLVLEPDNHNYVFASDKQGTDGTELNAYEAEGLEIYLGPDWSGKKFKLETDAGIYPDAVTVGEDGILKLEIGGSKNYKLMVMDDGKDKAVGDVLDKDGTDAPSNSDNAEESTTEKPENVNKEASTNKEDSPNTPSSEELQENAVTQPPVDDEGNDITDKDQDNDVQVEWTKEKDSKKGFTVFGIPLKHLIIFIVGMIIAIDGLIIINLIQRRRREDYEDGYYDDDYGEEYYDEEYYDDDENEYDDDYED